MSKAVPFDNAQRSLRKPHTDWRRVLGLREMGVYYALALVVALISIAAAYTGSVNYLSIQNIANVLQQSSLTAIIAVAMTVILISGNFDLSVASVAALSAAVMVALADSIGFVPACAVAMLVAISAGLLNGAIVQLLGINAFIVTLGTMTALRGVVLIVTDGRSLSVDNPQTLDAMRALESGRWPVASAFAVIGVVLAIASVYVAMRARRSDRGLPPGGGREYRSCPPFRDQRVAIQDGCFRTLQRGGGFRGHSVRESPSFCQCSSTEWRGINGYRICNPRGNFPVWWRRKRLQNGGRRPVAIHTYQRIQHPEPRCELPGRA